MKVGLTYSDSLTKARLDSTEEKTSKENRKGGKGERSADDAWDGAQLEIGLIPGLL